jgi:hypothetical protein
MKRQITLIITTLMLACSWGFTVAQNTSQTTSLSSYMTSRDKPITLTQWINSKDLA